MKKSVVLLAMCLCIKFGLLGQVPQDSALHRTFEKLDSLFFEKGFNQCDLEFLDGAIHKNLVFYHDQSGIQNKDVFFQSVKNNICGEGSQKPIRKVEKESLQVFPLYDNGKLYGVIQNGTHQFFLRESGKPDVFTSRAKFSHLYLREEESWLLKEVFSFDHQDPEVRE